MVKEHTSTMTYDFHLGNTFNKTLTLEIICRFAYAFIKYHMK